MNDILKQRLVGALVLIALGVIFWPVIFVEGERGSLDRTSQLEPMPALKDVAIPAPRPIEGVEPVRPAPKPTPEEVKAAEATAVASAVKAEPEPKAKPEPAPKPAPKPKTKPKPQPKPEPKPKPSELAAAKTVPSLPDKDSGSASPQSPALDEQGIPIAWVLQVASVGTRAGADELTADLIAQGYKAYHRAVRRDDVVLYRVFIGPVFEREKLTSVKRDIDRQLKVSALIARYVP